MMRNWSILWIACMALAGLLVPAAAQADTLTFFGEDINSDGEGRVNPRPNSAQAQSEFLAHLDDAGVADLEQFSDEPDLPLVVDFGTAGEAKLTGGGDIDVVTSGISGGGRFPTSGDVYFTADTDDSEPFTLEFEQAQSAFGFFATDVGDFEGQLLLTLTDNLGNTQQVEVPNTVGANNASVLYFGLIQTDASDAFTSVTFTDSNETGEDVFGFDDFTIGIQSQVQPPSAIPAPSALAGGLMLLGGLVLRRRRRRC